MTAPRTKQFGTLEVASALTGIAMCTTSVTRMSEICAWLLGGPVWTHELIHEPTMDAVKGEGYRQFPLLPQRENAQANWEAAARQAVVIYGETLTVHEGTHGRREHPEDTMRAVGVSGPIVTITTGGPEDGK